MTRNAPPDRGFVTLAQALSWIAFGDWSNSEDHWKSYADGKQRLERALEKLCDAACAGTLELRGRLAQKHDDDPRRFDTSVIPKERFHDFRQYDQMHCGLRVGGGLLGFGDENAQAFTYVHQPIVRKEFYRDVVLSKDQLVGEFPTPGAGTTASYGRVVEWCLDWIATEKGKNGNKAWQAFNATPEFRGCTREDFFRPAWEEAKTKV